ncbi:COX15/CtaA family protein [Aurantimicrobium minutum]|uniref:COX15/CtaA family protein n=1 Tax=Aurantimicrobium minutum TaxID=708131 RepID=UPI002476E40E|nr:COX15/CtaA family protein [Aurantimicrobium minutum]MDH6208231.1 cytochrome c oxidase assembly protein subunit 15 [Aurantimicrobium minutum]MDH6424848.1 cytochrome c oxidase assembly protein subunit 15 [Aurantimicrobium minutum]MDH6537388.1 cytochrome c oxidase assembly protein subunit 15 [Aurantimicrobium minutum]
MSTLVNWFPTTVDRKVRIAAWTTFVVQILIVVTGGAVRLTASGLGCPTWPTCTEDSLVNTPEMGIHGIIEFGNRLLTFLLVIVAIVTFALVFRMRKSRRDFFWLTLLIGLGIPAQAVIGGISVLMQLNPYVVGLHFIVSIVMIVLSTVLVFRVYNGNAPRTWILSPSGLSLPRIVWLAAVFQIVTIILGILTTGSGPHAGDADAPRNGLDGGILQSLHSYPAYVAVGLTLLAIAMASRARQLAERNALLILLAVNVAQIVVGIVQSRTGLPPLLVGIHMLLACLVAAGTTNALLNLRKPAE